MQLVVTPAEVKIGNGADRQGGDRAAQGSGDHGTHADGAKGGIILPGRSLQVATNPAGVERFVARYASLHKGHGVKVGAAGIDGASSVDNRQMLLIVDLLERGQRWVQAKATIKVDGAVGASRFGEGDGGAHVVVVGPFGKGGDDAQAIHAAAQKDVDQHIARPRGHAFRAAKGQLGHPAGKERLTGADHADHPAHLEKLTSVYIKLFAHDCVLHPARGAERPVGITTLSVVTSKSPCHLVRVSAIDSRGRRA